MRCIIVSMAAIAALGLAVGTSDAQGFRRGSLGRPAVQTFQQRPFVPFNNGFGQFNNGFVTPLPTVTRATAGSFNPVTGAFSPGLAGPFTLTQRHGFQPVNGNFTPSPTGNFVLQARQTFNPITGTFVPSTNGNIVARERGTFTPNNGSFTNAASGSFNPITGRFAPNSTGPFTLASRANFIPSNGLFVPSASGSFVLATREAFRPATNTFVPSSSGSFLFQTRGDFLPATTAAAFSNRFNVGGTGTFSNPFLGTNSVAQNLRFVSQSNATVAALGFNPFGFNNSLGFGFNNPFFTNPALAFNNPLLANSFAFGNPWGHNPYAWNNANPYLTGYGGSPYYGGTGYGGSPYYGGSYGGQYANAAPYSNSGYQPSYAAPASYASNTASIPAYMPARINNQQPVLGAYGIPSDDNGVKWPLAFRLMSPDDKQDLLDPLESRIQVLTKQAAAGNVNPSITRLAQQNMNELRRWLGTHRTQLAIDTVQDASDFLHTVDKALASMRPTY